MGTRYLTGLRLRHPRNRAGGIHELYTLRHVDQMPKVLVDFWRSRIGWEERLINTLPNADIISSHPCVSSFERKHALAPDLSIDLSTIWFGVEGEDDGFSVRQFAAVQSCRLDGLNAMVSKRTSVHFLNENEVVLPRSIDI
ncbi:hypothetical protein BS628_01015 [Agrobacterium radiobacter]|nr:hypothetical protein ASH09_26060 [Agrobacterium radiobacter]OOO40391.1 hypothetical protein BS628_01015 [Agrobacterium radiobacter]